MIPVLMLAFSSYFPKEYLPCLGSWSLVATTDPRIPLKTELFVDYNMIEVSIPHAVGPASITQTFHGNLVVSDSATNVVWLKVTDVDVDVGLLPRVRVPYITKYQRMRLHPATDETGAFFAVTTKDHEYNFRKSIVRRKTPDTIAKIFVTQLLFDYVIHHF